MSAASEIVTVVERNPSVSVTERPKTVEVTSQVQGGGGFYGHPIIRGEVPVGVIDGINKSFFTSQNLTSPIMWIYLNGLPLMGVEYEIIQPNQIRLLEAPLEGDSVIIDYFV